MPGRAAGAPGHAEVGVLIDGARYEAAQPAAPEHVREGSREARRRLRPGRAPAGQAELGFPAAGSRSNAPPRNLPSLMVWYFSQDAVCLEKCR